MMVVVLVLVVMGGGGGGVCDVDRLSSARSRRRDGGSLITVEGFSSGQSSRGKEGNTEIER